MEAPPSPGPDQLPTNKTELEGLRNSHVSQLEILAKRVKLFNEHIDLDSIVLSNLKHEDKSKMAATVMQKRIRSQVRCKRDLATNVEYHREELKKVLTALMKDKDGEMKEADGEAMLSTYVMLLIRTRISTKLAS